jgi:(2R)-sulfolactate sulfo-lyase subunit alpha
MGSECIVRGKADTVGIVVVQDVQAGDDITGWILDADESVSLRAVERVPFGHKIALRDIKAGEAVLQFGHSIGLAAAEIACGSHVHTHNLTSTRA